MVDFKKALEKKRAAARIKPVIIEDHPWYRLLCVQDNLNIVLRQVYDHDKGKMFVYEYTDEIGYTGRPSTKFGMELTMPESQISDELEKSIFKIVNHNDHGRSKNIDTSTEKADPNGILGESKIVHPTNSGSQQSTLFGS